MTASEDATLIAVTVAMGFVALVFSLFQIFAPDSPSVIVAAATLGPVFVGFTADVIGTASGLSSAGEEVSE